MIPYISTAGETLHIHHCKKLNIKKVMHLGRFSPQRPQITQSTGAIEYRIDAPVGRFMLPANDRAAGGGQQHNLPTLRTLFERIEFLAMTEIEGRQTSYPLARTNNSLFIN
jgi:hypothetical protein